jgi:hypothetical protein
MPQLPNHKSGLIETHGHVKELIIGKRSESITNGAEWKRIPTRLGLASTYSVNSCRGAKPKSKAHTVYGESIMYICVVGIVIFVGFIALTVYLITRNNPIRHHDVNPILNPISGHSSSTDLNFETKAHTLSIECSREGINSCVMNKQSTVHERDFSTAENFHPLKSIPTLKEKYGNSDAKLLLNLERKPPPQAK